MNIMNNYLCARFGAALAGIAALFRGSRCKVRYGILRFSKVRNLNSGLHAAGRRRNPSRSGGSVITILISPRMTALAARKVKL